MLTKPLAAASGMPVVVRLSLRLALLRASLRFPWGRYCTCPFFLAIAPKAGSVYDAALRWEEKLFWLARGYRVIQFVEITCIQHGTFRSAIGESEPESYPCAICQCACRAVILGEGVTRHELPLWELVEKAFAGSKARHLLMMESVLDESYRQPRRKIADRHRRKIAQATAASV
jgi:hypothetical protein